MKFPSLTFQNKKSRLAGFLRGSLPSDFFPYLGPYYTVKMRTKVFAALTRPELEGL